MDNQSSQRRPFATFAQTLACFAVKKRHSSILKIISLLIILFYSFVVFGQETKLSESIISIAEDLAADEEDPEAVEMYIEMLNDLSEDPVRINSSDVKEISRLFFLSDFQVKALSDYVHSTGQIVTIYEIAAIPGFDKETAEMILPFISLEKTSINNNDSVRWNNSLISNFSIKSSNYDTSFLGSAFKILTRYKFTSGSFTGGFTTEKDPGEKFLTGSPMLPDFLSAHLAYNGRGVTRRIIIGDFSACFGQGTNLNSGIRRGISTTLPGYMSASNEIRPYTSAEENRFFRGVAAEFGFKNIDLSLFLSRNYSDATLGSLPDSSDGYIENFYTAGIHNTSSLLKKKDAVALSGSGINLACNLRNIKFGIVWSEIRLSLPVIHSVDDPITVYNFSGNKNTTYSLYYNCFIKNLLFYGELSLNETWRIAAIQGISFRPSDRLSFNFLYRHYDPGYTSIFGNGPGSGSKTTNETGILGNFTYEAAKHLFISGGVDIKKVPWLKYRCSSPTQGARKELRVKYLPTDNLILESSYNYIYSMVDASENPGIPVPEEVKTRTVKSSARYTLSDNLTIGIRVDYKRAYSSEGRGVLLLQDLIYSFRKYPVGIWFRYCLFKTDDWDSRLYTYENDLLYSFSIPALSGEGSRSYMMIKWDIRKFAELRVKYGITSLVKNINSVKNTEEIKMQLRLWF